MRGFETALNSEIDLLMTRLAGIADGKTTVSMMEEFNHLTLDIIGKVKIKTLRRFELNYLMDEFNHLTLDIIEKVKIKATKLVHILTSTDSRLVELNHLTQDTIKWVSLNLH